MGLTVRYGSLTAVDNLSFSADVGQVVALLGPNGAGKTTTVETLEGYRSPTAGRVRVLGLDPRRDHARLTPRMGVMLQRGGVYPGIRAGECLRLFAAYYDDPTDPDELLARLGLERQASTAWRRLSGGEQQRLSLALALVGKPRVAFLDEPTAGVDVGGRQVVRRVIRDLAAGGTCVLVASHELDEVERIADRVVIVDRGRLLATGTPSELVRQGGGDQVRFGAPAGLDVAALGGHLAAIVTEVAPGEYLLDAPASPATVASLTAWLAQRDLPLADLRAGRQSLEDVFVRLTGKGDGG
jgi:ABC-2 type transport system ATP-binding protein